MRISKILLGVIFSIPLYLNAASFSLNGKVINSIVNERFVECGSYQIQLVNEHFPYKHEMEVPKQFRIDGFYGSAATVNKSAYFIPGKIKIPNPSEIANLKESYPTNRTYLPASAVCRDNILIVSYWSGGNCRDCEAFVQFKIVDNQLTRPEKVNYSHVKAMK